MASIADIRNPWRDDWRQASFRGAAFHVEVGARAGGRRIVPHEYPKRDDPYAEDMGRRARRWHVTAYFISYPVDGNGDTGEAVLRLRDYRVGRDALIRALEQEGPGTLVHPTLGSMEVACETYTVQDAIREKGGFCVFEMTFCEAGVQGNDVVGVQTGAVINQNATNLQRKVNETTISL